MAHAAGARIRSAREGRLLIRACNACGTKHFMPRHLCPQCWSDQLEWVDSQGRGTVYVAQQPNASNGYTAVIRVRDPQGGYGFYDFEVDYR